MTQRTFPMAGSKALLSILALGFLGLSGCGSDTSKTESGRIVLTVAKGLKEKLAPGKAAAGATAPDPDKLAAAAKAAFAGPIILAQFEQTRALTVLGEYGRNGTVRTYSTPDKQTLSLRHGLLVATRGLGNDLMSSEHGNAASLITRRQAGSTDRTYRYLDGEGRERPLPMRCNVTRGAAKNLTLSGTGYATVQMDETCSVVGQPLTITNSYWVTGSGTVALSHQWIGPAIGHVTIQLVRP